MRGGEVCCDVLHCVEFSLVRKPVVELDPEIPPKIDGSLIHPLWFLLLVRRPWQRIPLLTVGFLYREVLLFRGSMSNP